MPKVAVLDMAGKEVGSIDLSEAVFGMEPNKSVMLHMVKNYLANQRQGTQSALTRAAARSRGVRRARAMRVRVPPAPRSGRTAASCLRRSRATTATP